MIRPGLGLVQAARVLGRGLDDRRQTVRVAHRSHQQCPPRTRRERSDARSERPLDCRTPSQRIVERLHPESLPLAQPRRNLEQRQRVPARCRNELRDDSRRKRQPRRLPHQPARVLGAESQETKIVDASSLEVRRLAVTRTEQDHDTLIRKPTRSEQERITRGRIDPLRIIHHAQQRPVLRHQRHDPERRRIDREAIHLPRTAQGGP